MYILVHLHTYIAHTNKYVCLLVCTDVLEIAWLRLVFFSSFFWVKLQLTLPALTRKPNKSADLAKYVSLAVFLFAYHGAKNFTKTLPAPITSPNVSGSSSSANCFSSFCFGSSSVAAAANNGDRLSAQMASGINDLNNILDCFKIAYRLRTY